MVGDPPATCARTADVPGLPVRPARRPDVGPAGGGHALRGPAADPGRGRAAARRASSPAASPGCCSRASGRRNILAITFTNKAAGEMQQRVEALVPGNRVWISTFHSLGARLLRQYADRLGLDRNFTIYDQDDRNKAGQAGPGGRRHRQRAASRPERIGGAISKAKNQLLTPERYAAHGAATSSARRWPASTPSTRSGCATRNALDFDDLLYCPALALKHDEELRAELDARFRFVLIDEYQDTNHGPVRDRPRPVGRSPEPVRGRRPGPIDLQVARLGHPQHPRLRARLPGRPRHHAGQELPQHQGDPATRPTPLIAHNRQRKPKDLVTDNPQGEPVTRADLRHRPRRGRAASPGGSQGRRRGGQAQATATSPSSCASTP